MISFFTGRIGMWIAAFAVVAGSLVWLRQDAVNDAFDRVEKDNLEQRIENRDDARNRRNEIKDLPSDDLSNRLYKHMRP